MTSAADLVTDDPNLWAMDFESMRPGGPEWPVYAHLIIRRYDGGFLGEVRVGACGREFTAGTHPRGWWGTQAGRFPLQEHAIHCGHDQIRAQEVHMPCE